MFDFYHLKNSLEGPGSIVQWCHSGPRFCLSLSAVFCHWLSLLRILSPHRVTFKDGREWGRKKLPLCEVLFLFKEERFREISPSPLLLLHWPEKGHALSLTSPRPRETQSQIPIPNPSLLLGWRLSFLTSSTLYPSPNGLLLARKKGVES